MICFQVIRDPWTMNTLCQYQSAFSGLHWPFPFLHLLKIDDPSVPKGSQWKQPRKNVGEATHSDNTCVWSTCSGTILNTEDASESKTDKFPTSQNSHFSGGDRWGRETGAPRKEREGKGDLEQGEERVASYWDESMMKKIQWGVGQAGLSPRRLNELRLEWSEVSRGD